MNKKERISPDKGIIIKKGYLYYVAQKFIRITVEGKKFKRKNASRLLILRIEEADTDVVDGKLFFGHQEKLSSMIHMQEPCSKSVFSS